jgi:hypothetical protein
MNGQPGPPCIVLNSDGDEVPGGTVYRPQHEQELVALREQMTTALIRVGQQTTSLNAKLEEQTVLLEGALLSQQGKLLEQQAALLEQKTAEVAALQSVLADNDWQAQRDVERETRQLRLAEKMAQIKLNATAILNPAGSGGHGSPSSRPPADGRPPVAASPSPAPRWRETERWAKASRSPVVGHDESSAGRGRDWAGGTVNRRHRLLALTDGLAPGANARDAKIGPMPPRRGSSCVRLGTSKHALHGVLEQIAGK